MSESDSTAKVVPANENTNSNAIERIGIAIFSTCERNVAPMYKVTEKPVRFDTQLGECRQEHQARLPINHRIKCGSFLSTEALEEGSAPQCVSLHNIFY